VRVHHSVSHREANHEVADEQGDRRHQQEQQQFKRIQAHTVTVYARREARPRDTTPGGWPIRSRHCPGARPGLPRAVTPNPQYDRAPVISVRRLPDLAADR
jgi:hypothetical protein